MASRLERSYLTHGTFNGPVTQEMIDLAKVKHAEACRGCGHQVRKDGWEDWIPVAREELGIETQEEHDGHTD